MELLFPVQNTADHGFGTPRVNPVKLLSNFTDLGRAASDSRARGRPRVYGTATAARVGEIAPAGGQRFRQSSSTASSHFWYQYQVSPILTP